MDRARDCGWQLIYDRLKKLNRLGEMDKYQTPKNNSRWSRPRSLTMVETGATFKSLAGELTISRKDYAEATQTEL